MVKSEFPLSNAVAIVTGASSGLGEELARMLALEGVSVALAARRHQELERVAASISESGATAIAVTADMRDHESLRHLASRVETELGDIDILVNNAATDHVAFVHNMNMADWDDVMAVNLRAPTVLCRTLLPGMRRRRRGYIVNIGSEASTHPYAGSGAYAVSKSALSTLTELIDLENREHGIKAWCISPGWIDTPMADPYPDADRSRFLKPGDVVELVRFLLKQSARVRMGPDILIRTSRDPFESSEE